jgi:hypothetical protein
MAAVAVSGSSNLCSSSKSFSVERARVQDMSFNDTRQAPPAKRARTVLGDPDASQQLVRLEPAAATQVEHAQQQVHYAKYAPLPNGKGASDRLGIPPSATLLQKIFQIYGRRGRRAHVSTLGVHSLNERHHEKHIARLALNIARKGVNLDARGKAVGVEVHDAEGTVVGYDLIAAGSLRRALTFAGKKWPQNPNVVAALNEEWDVDSLEPSTPDDILIWVRDWLNAFHENGASVTMIQMLEDAPAVGADWALFKDANHFKSRTVKGDATVKNKCAEFLKERHGAVYTSVNHFDACRIVMGSLGKDAWGEPMLKLLGDLCDVTDKRLNHTSACINIHHLYNVVSKMRSSGVAVDHHLKMMFFEGLKFLAPLTDFEDDGNDDDVGDAAAKAEAAELLTHHCWEHCSARPVPFIFAKTSFSTMDLLKFPMGQSVFYTKPIKQTKEAEVMFDIPPLMVADVDAGDSGDAKLREICAGEFASLVLDSILKKSSVGGAPGSAHPVERHIWSLLEEFIWAESVLFDGKKHADFSVLLYAICKSFSSIAADGQKNTDRVAIKNLLGSGASGGAVESASSSSCIAQILLDSTCLAASSKLGQVAPKQADLPDSLAAIIAEWEDDASNNLDMFSKAHPPNKSVRRYRDFQPIVDNIWEELEIAAGRTQSGGEVDLKLLTKLLATHLLPVFPDHWAKLASIVAEASRRDREAAGRKKEGPDVFALPEPIAFFNTLQHIVHVSEVRTKYVCKLVLALCIPDGPYQDQLLTEKSKSLIVGFTAFSGFETAAFSATAGPSEKAFVRIAEADMLLGTVGCESEWQTFWFEIMQALSLDSSGSSALRVADKVLLEKIPKVPHRQGDEDVPVVLGVLGPAGSGGGAHQVEAQSASGGTVNVTVSCLELSSFPAAALDAKVARDLSAPERNSIPSFDLKGCIVSLPLLDWLCSLAQAALCTEAFKVAAFEQLGFIDFQVGGLTLVMDLSRLADLALPFAGPVRLSRTKDSYQICNIRTKCGPDSVDI